MRYTRLSRIMIHTLMLLVTAGVVGGCVTVGADHVDDRTVSVESATSVNTTVIVRAGELMVGGGGGVLAETEFTYNVAAFRPDVTYTEKGNKGELLIEQPATQTAFFLSGQTKNLWDLKFSETIPLNVQFQLGATESQIDLSKLTLGTVSINGGAGNLNVKLVGEPDLNELSLELGAGRTTVDLAGLWKEDVDVNVEGGVGDISVRLPADVGVRASIDVGAGSVDVEGLHKDGNVYLNEEWESNPVSIDLKIDSGVGRISVVTD